MSLSEELPRLLRTLAPLRAPQVFARPLQLVARHAMPSLLQALGRPSDGPLRDRIQVPISAALRRHVDREATRAHQRVARLSAFDSSLASYERAYGRELPGVASVDRAAWQQPEALHPYPASVRARSIALAIRLGRPGLENDLAQASRAALIQLEFHLMGNHLLENGIGLSCAAAVSRGAEANAWRHVGGWLLNRELDEQFLHDGGHFERSASYHGWLLTGLLELWELRRAAGLAMPDPWRRAVQRALDWAAQVEAPDGTWPLFNDCALDSCPTPANIFELAADLGLRPAQPTRNALQLLSDTGWAIARRGPAVMVARVGPIGARYIAGHAHADSLTFELWVHGHRLVVDAGIARYGAGPLRAWCRSTAAHNTMGVDARDSAEVWGAFRVGRQPESRVLSADDTGDAVTLRAEHDGYAHLPGRPIHRRTWTLRNDSLAIDDELHGAGTHAALVALRVDDDAAAAVGARVTMNGKSAPSLAGDWHPTHGVRRAARCFASGGLGELPLEVRTELRWKNS